MLISIAIIYLSISYILTPSSYIDFPCFYEVRTNRLELQNIDESKLKDLLVMISIYPEHTNGGICFNETANLNENIQFNDFKIKANQDGLFINNKLMQPGDSVYTSKRTFDMSNLWWTYKYEFELNYFGKFDQIQKQGNAIPLTNWPLLTSLTASFAVVEFENPRLPRRYDAKPL